MTGSQLISCKTVPFMTNQNGLMSLAMSVT